MKLYELAFEYQQVLDLIGEVEDSVIIDTLEAIQGEMEPKFENLVKIVKSLEARVTAREKEIERLKRDNTTDENTISRLKEYMKRTMIAIQTPKIEVGLFKLSIQKNPPALIVDDPDNVPRRFLVQQDPTIDKATIKECLKAGETFSFAHLSSGESLRIR